RSQYIQRLGQQASLALPVPSESFCLWQAAFDSPKTGELNLTGVPLLRLLGRMRVTGGPSLRFHTRDVNELGGRKHHGIFADFVEVQCGFLAAPQPGIEDEHRDGAVIPVPIDGPLRENDV